MNEKQALAALRHALDSVRLAEKACAEAGFGGVHVLRPLELIRADLEEVVAVVEGK